MRMQTVKLLMFFAAVLIVLSTVQAAMAETQASWDLSKGFVRSGASKLTTANSAVLIRAHPMVVPLVLPPNQPIVNPKPLKIPGCWMVISDSSNQTGNLSVCR